MWNKQRREKLKATPFPPDWSRILVERFPLYQRLPDADRKELQGHIQVFLAEKKLEGCGGLEITEEMKVCIAAQACLLLLHRNTDYYPGLRSILVYPTAYFVKTTRHVGAAVMEERFDNRLGEAWDSGAVVLAWDAVDTARPSPMTGTTWSCMSLPTNSILRTGRPTAPRYWGARISGSGKEADTGPGRAC